MITAKNAERVLLVDDDPMLVDSLSRVLSRKFDIATALDGPDALDAMEQAGPFAVVVTDMRMPGMNGVELIGHARALSPRTVFMMLTGNQDVGTALRAVNEGEAFRVLHKPCRNADLIRAIEAGLRYHRALTAEHELLSSTVIGAVRVQAELLHRACPELERHAEGFTDLVNTLSSGLGLDHHWELKLAAELAACGFVLNINAQDAWPSPADGRDALVKHWCAAAGAGAHHIAQVPRLGGVADRLRIAPQADVAILERTSAGGGDSAEPDAAVVRVAIEAHVACVRGLRGREVSQAVQQALPTTPDPVLSLLEAEAGIAAAPAS
ncbi:MAG: response regulator [Planctomycetota bacterium]